MLFSMIEYSNISSFFKVPCLVNAELEGLDLIENEGTYYAFVSLNSENGLPIETDHIPTEPTKSDFLLSPPDGWYNLLF